MPTLSAVRISWRSGSTPSAYRRLAGAGAVLAGPILEDGDRLPLLDHLALPDQDLADGARHRGGDRDLHLHRLEDHQRVVLLDLLADLGDDLPQVADQLRLDLGHTVPPIFAERLRVVGRAEW